jgi:hypothetical protein
VASRASVERLIRAFDEIVAAPTSQTTVVETGRLRLKVRHNHPGVGDDVLRALWPAIAEPGADYDILCLSAADPLVASLMPAALPDDARLLVPERHTGQRWFLDGRIGLFTGLDRSRRTGLVIWGDGAYRLLMCAPFRTLAQWAAADMGDLMLHGAGVGRPEGGVLLLGAGHAGKSTTALATVAAGGVTVGDDYVWLRNKEAVSCFRTVKTRHSARVRLVGAAAGLPGFDMYYDEPKRVHYLDHADHAMVRRLPLLGAAVVRIGAATTQWRRIAPVEAFLQAAPTSILQATTDRAQQMRQIKHLLTDLPTYELSVSADFLEVGDTVLRFVDTLIAQRV